MIAELQQALGNSEYDTLPAAIRATMTLQQYLWMSDSQKASLIQDETEPESFDD